MIQYYSNGAFMDKLLSHTHFIQFIESVPNLNFMPGIRVQKLNQSEEKKKYYSPESMTIAYI